MCDSTQWVFTEALRCIPYSYCYYRLFSYCVSPPIRFAIKEVIYTVQLKWILLAYTKYFHLDPFSTFQLCESNEVSKDFHPDNKNFKKISDLRKYYYIEKSEPVTWFEALHKCRKLGGDLINFENEKEFLAVTKSLNKQRHFWIDMTNLSDQKEYKSIVTGQKPSFLKWYEQEPNNKGQNENCAELVTHAMKNKHKKKQWFMNDFECGLRNYFICETKLPTQLTIVVWWMLF